MWSQPTRWPLQASHYQNVPHNQVDWASLAKQWISMQQQSAPPPPPPPPPPTPSTQGQVQPSHQSDSFDADILIQSSQKNFESHLDPPGDACPQATWNQDSKSSGAYDGSFFYNNVLDGTSSRGTYSSAAVISNNTDSATMVSLEGPAASASFADRIIGCQPWPHSLTRGPFPSMERQVVDYRHGPPPTQSMPGRSLGVVMDYGHGGPSHSLNNSIEKRVVDYAHGYSSGHLQQDTGPNQLHHLNMPRMPPGLNYQPLHNSHHAHVPLLESPGQHHEPHHAPRGVAPLLPPVVPSHLLQPAAIDSSAISLDAARRKNLPAWIREGLEKMERDKMKKKLEEERRRKLELDRKKPLWAQESDDVALSLGECEGGETTVGSEKVVGRPRILTEKPVTGQALQNIEKPIESDEELPDDEAAVKETDALSASDCGHLSETINKVSHEAQSVTQGLSPPRVILTAEERDQQFALNVKRFMTEILISVLDTQLNSISNEELTRARNQITAKPKKVTTALANIVGIGGYSDSDDSGSGRGGLSDEDSDHLKERISARRKAFRRWEEAAMKDLEEREIEQTKKIENRNCVLNNRSRSPSSEGASSAGLDVVASMSPAGAHNNKSPVLRRPHAHVDSELKNRNSTSPTKPASPKDFPVQRNLSSVVREGFDFHDAASDSSNEADRDGNADREGLKLSENDKALDTRRTGSTMDEPKQSTSSERDNPVDCHRHERQKRNDHKERKRTRSSDRSDTDESQSSRCSRPKKTSNRNRQRSHSGNRQTRRKKRSSNSHSRSGSSDRRRERSSSRDHGYPQRSRSRERHRGRSRSRDSSRKPRSASRQPDQPKDRKKERSLVQVSSYSKESRKNRFFSRYSRKSRHLRSPSRDRDNSRSTSRERRTHRLRSRSRNRFREGSKSSTHRRSRSRSLSRRRDRSLSGDRRRNRLESPYRDQRRVRSRDRRERSRNREGAVSVRRRR